MSRSFIPLQIVDKDNLTRLFGDSKEVLSEKYLRKILNKRVKTIDFGEEGDLVEGGVKRLRDVRNRLSEIPEERLIHIFWDMDVFSFNCYIKQCKIP